MHSFTPTAPPVNLSEALAALGYRPGTPPHVTPSSAAIDRRACCRLACPECEAVGLDYRPFYRDSSYRVLACCRVCQFQGEV
jgi:hypothetical protein